MFIYLQASAILLTNIALHLRQCIEIDKAADTRASVMVVCMGVCMSFSTIKRASCLIGLHDQERVQRVCTRVLKKHNV